MVGDRIMISLLYNKSSGYPYEIDEKVVFDNILLIASKEHTLIGRPLIPNAKVTAIVDEVTQLVTKRWIWKRKRLRKQRIIGSRDWITILRITDIDCDFVQFVDQSIINQEQ